MNWNHRKVLPLFAAVLALASAAWLLWRSPPAANAAIATPRPMQVPDQAAVGTSGSSLLDMPPARLPPPNAPIAAIAAALQQRADAGDSRAACRLAAELIRCRQVAQILPLYEAEKTPLPDRLAGAGKLDEAISLDELRLEKYELQKQCLALPEGLAARAGEYLAQAARAGESEAMMLYLEGQHFPASRMGMLGDPGFEAWHRDTPAMAQALVQRGHPEGAFIQALAYGDDLTAFGGRVPDDPVLREAYSVLLRRLAGTAEPARPNALGAEDLMRARGLAEDWHARHFNNRRFEKNDLTRRLTLMALRRRDAIPAPCES